MFFTNNPNASKDDDMEYLIKHAIQVIKSTYGVSVGTGTFDISGGIQGFLARIQT